MDEEKYKKVEQWLSSVYGDEPVPQYEIDAMSVDLLYNLSQTAATAQSHSDALIADLDNKAREYKAETEYLGKLFDVLRLKPEDLSSTGQSHLRVLTDLAYTLQLKDASDSSYLLAMTSLNRGLMKTTETRKRVLSVGGKLHDKTKSALKKAAVLEKTLQVLEEQCQLQAKSTASRVKEAKFMRGKAREYSKTIEAYRNKLPAEYVTHQMLLQKSEQLEDLNKKLVPLKSRLNGYHSLPPNINLTKVKIEETRREIAAIEEELARIVSEI